MKIIKLISPKEASRFRDEFLKLQASKGVETAGVLAKLVKNNNQILPTSSEIAKKILMAFQNGILSSPEFLAFAYPKKIIKIMCNFYETNQYYGKHVDNAIIDIGKQSSGRADLSFTLFLADKSEYQGGELVIYDDQEEIEYKLNAGEMIIYDSGKIHEVRKVTSGKRICIVGWIESYIKDTDLRIKLSNLDEEIAKLIVSETKTQDEILLLQKNYNDLLRLNSQ
jgi:PKHD-type hydroxylase